MQEKNSWITGIINFLRFNFPGNNKINLFWGNILIPVFILFGCNNFPVINPPTGSTIISSPVPATNIGAPETPCNSSVNTMIPKDDFGQISSDSTVQVESVSLPYENLGINIGLWRDPYLNNINQGSIDTNLFKGPFKATVKLSDGSIERNVDWYSSDNCIVSPSKDGKLRGFKEGTAIITAVSKRDYSKTAKLKVVVYSNNYQPLSSPKGNKIAFLSDKEGSLHLYTMNRDGTDQRKINPDIILTNNKTFSWSPDGTKIVFEGQKDGKQGLFLINNDGSNLIRIPVENPSNNFSFWSLDGKKIAFFGETGIYPEVTNNLYITDSNGSNLKILKTNLYPLELKWSPDSRKISFISSYQSILMVIDVNSKEETVLDASAASYCWSPDSQRLIYIPFVEDNGIPFPDTRPPREISIINIDGTNKKTFFSGYSYFEFAYPALSPDGKKIAFIAISNFVQNIFTISPDSSGLVNITNNNYNLAPSATRFQYNSAPLWSPDSKKITLNAMIYKTEYSGGLPETQVVNTENYNVTHFTPLENISWSSDSKNLVFQGIREKDVYLSGIDALEIYSVDAATRLQQILTNNNYFNTVKKQEDIPNPPISLPDFKPGAPINKENLKGRIVFTIFDKIKWNVFIMDASGNNQKQLTNDNNYNNSPKLSPDGSKVAYISTETNNTNRSINIINTDGTDLLKLPGTDQAGVLDWSPDGKKILFTSGMQISVINADGTELKNLTSSDEFKSEPKWSPDGKKIAFTWKMPYGNELFLINSDGSGLVNLTNRKIYSAGPFDWSPDGSKIAFNSGNIIYSINTDGTGLSSLTNKSGGNEGLDTNPVWSPDGRKISFISQRDGEVRKEKLGSGISFEMYTMNSDGSGQTRLTFNEDEEYNPAWSKDGLLIFFASGRDSVRDEKGTITETRNELYVMNGDGTNQTRVTDIKSFPTYFDMK
jgi:Tol biopolymer transport system component